MSGYLLDTNSVIYFFNGEEPISKLIKDAENSISISFETENDTTKKIAEFISEIEVVYISDEIIEMTIDYRKTVKLKIPDAIIAATAKVKELTLVTADKSLTQKLKELKIVNPI